MIISSAAAWARPEFAPARPYAFTLIELLAVIAIASLVLTVAALSINAMNDHVALERAAAMVRSMDARGRLFARTSGEAVVLVLDEDARALRLVGVREVLPFAEGGIGRGIEMSLSIADRERPVIFDTRGTTDDYSITLRTETREVELSFRGLTGAAAMAEDSP
jgi:prepilin-type N-terminal cleavage/methylation domain-containing protein